MPPAIYDSAPVEADVISIGLGLASLVIAVIGILRDGTTRSRVNDIEAERDVRQLDSALDALIFVVHTGLPLGDEFVGPVAIGTFQQQWHKAVGRVRGSISREGQSAEYANSAKGLEEALAGVAAHLHTHGDAAEAPISIANLRTSTMIVGEAAEALRTVIATRRTP